MDLDLNQLVDNLISESKEKQKEEKKKARVGQWEITHLTLVKQTARCQCCKREYAYPATITTQLDHPKLGTRYEPYDGMACPDIAFASLPKRIIELHEEVPACQFCFDLTSLVEEALNAPESQQLSFQFTEYDGKTPIRLGGRAKAGKHGIVYV